jgi:hypothetical protein
LVRQRFFVGAVSAHLVRFIDDDQVPVATQQRLLGILDARHPGDRGNDLVFLLPRIGSIVRPQHIAADDLEVFPKFVFELALPLE